MYEHNTISSFKLTLITKLMRNVKRFNNEHKKCAKVTTVFTLILIVLMSAVFWIAAHVASVFKAAFASEKRRLVVLTASLLLVVGVVAYALSSFTMTVEAEKEPEEEPEQVVETIEIPTPDDPVLVVPKETASEEEDTIWTEYPEAVAWVYFEDGHISYPIMQGEDNEIYRVADAHGEVSDTGAIFLDCRSSADFSDSNSIVYGHNMKNGSMFGTLRDYREDPEYYNDHQYFQVWTKDKKYRYLIFAYMDVPNDYVIYDYVGGASRVFVEDAEPVRRKSYMDSEIVVNDTKKVVTLSTCTDKDELRFVVLGVMVEENDCN